MISAMQVVNQPSSDVMGVIDRSNLAPNTKRNYKRAVAGYLETGGGLLDAQALAAYAEGLSDAAKGPLKAAVKLYTERVKQQLDAGVDPNAEDAVELSARVNLAERRLNAVQRVIEVRTPKGEKTHIWLSQDGVRALFDSCADDLQGERDRLALGLMAAAGLRREEAANLTFADVKRQPVKGRVRTVLAVEGKGRKGRKRRTVPISDNLAGAIRRWGRHVNHQGRVLRSIDQRGELRDSISGVALFHIVQEHGAAIGLPDLAPHDLRRTYAQLGFEAGIPITQISKLLGHVSVATTQRYLNLDLDLETTISDFIPFEAR